jgi:ribosome-associated protein
MRGVCDFTDFFVIATGRNTRQTKAIYDEVAGVLKKEHELLPRASAGVTEATWILADYLDVVLHLFTPDTRGFYRLEELWSDVPSIELEVRPPNAVVALVGREIERRSSSQTREPRSPWLAHAGAASASATDLPRSHLRRRARARTVWIGSVRPVADASLPVDDGSIKGSAGYPSTTPLPGP